jgi:hypothetical protein
MRALQKELDELRDLRAREKEREMKRAQNDEEELQILRDRLEHLEDERGSVPSQVCPFNSALSSVSDL